MMTHPLHHILYPVSIEEFFEKYFEQDVLHISRNHPDYYKDIFTSKELSLFLDRQDIFYPSIRMVQNGKELSSNTYTIQNVSIGHHKKDGIIDTEKMFYHFNNGSTIVVQAAQRIFYNLNNACGKIADYFKSPVQANMYVTPTRSVGFNPHWDTHDVFVLQITGTKTWHLFGTEKKLPVKGQTLDIKNFKKSPIKTIQLYPGDLLYVPRGYVHDAMSDDGISTHITVGVLAHTWLRLFQNALSKLEDHEELRSAIPFWKMQDVNVTDKVKELLSIISKLPLEKEIDSLAAKYKTIQPQQTSGYFESILLLDKTTGNTMFSLNRNVVFSTSETDEQIRINFLGKALEFPIKMKEVLYYILNQKEFSAGNLHTFLDVESANSLLKKLVKEGMINIQENE